MPRRDLDEWFWQVGSDLQRLSEEMHRPRRTLHGRRFWEPKVDLIEYDSNAYMIKAEVAGVRADDIQLLYIAERHSILLRGIRREEDFPDTNRSGCYQLEIFYGEFEREIRLPEGEIEPENIRAQYRNGFLLVVVPKKVQPSSETIVTIRKI